MPILGHILAGGLADLLNTDLDLKPLASQGVIAINCQSAIFDAGHVKDSDFPGLVLHLHLCAEVTELRRNIFDIIGERQAWVVIAKSSLRCQFEGDLVTCLFTPYSIIHATNEFLATTKDEAKRQVTVLQYIAGFIRYAIGQAYVLPILDLLTWHLAVPVVNKGRMAMGFGEPLGSHSPTVIRVMGPVYPFLVFFPNQLANLGL